MTVPEEHTTLADQLTASSVSLDELCINSLRVLAMDAVQTAGSGHPGTPMALAPLCYVLWSRHLRHDPAAPHWYERDRFVLSCGHASILLYGLLYLSGYDLSLEEIRRFRQLGSKTPGHPEHGVTPGVETTTGPLGQGLGNAVGMAMAEAHLAALFNRPDHEIIDHRTYVVVSDGDLMEGISHEAASLAGHLRLGKLVVYYDDNRITIDGATGLAFSDDVVKRFEGYGWHVQRVGHGNDLAALHRATNAAKEELERPSLVVVRTHIAYGSPHKQDTAEAHGAPLGKEEVELTKRNLNWPSLEPFYVPDEAVAEWRKSGERGAELHAAWQKRHEAYAKKHSADARELDRRLAGSPPSGWEGALPAFKPSDGPMATRAASGKVLNALGKKVPELFGGAADLAGSVKTELKNGGDFSAGDRTGRNIHFGVREHAMAAAMSGMALHGGVRPYGGTFLIFSDYMRPAIRLAAMMECPTIYLFSHDSIGLGEDGPTHQPVESLAALRVIPGLIVLRPADANDVVEAWRWVIEYHGGPVALILSRQGLPVFDRKGAGLASAEGVCRGGYVLSDPGDRAPDVVLMGSGSEVELLLEASDELTRQDIAARVVNMPSLELFAAQPQAYRQHVLPPETRARLAVEAGHPLPWRPWVGDHGDVIGLERFGASAPYRDLLRHFGFTTDRVVERARALLSR